jgi:hypothetical protein
MSQQVEVVDGQRQFRKTLAQFFAQLCRFDDSTGAAESLPQRPVLVAIAQLP